MDIRDVKGKGVIYRFTSPSGKMYIGQSINFYERYKKYKRNDGSIGKHFSNAVSKYDGIQSFELDFLAVIDLSDTVEQTKSELNALEIYYIEKFNTVDDGYNLTGGGAGSYKRVVSKETREKLSKAFKGKNTIPDLSLICPNCGLEFTISPKNHRSRLKKSKSKKIYCSSRCGSIGGHTTR